MRQRLRPPGGDGGVRGSAPPGSDGGVLTEVQMKPGGGHGATGKQ